MRLTSVIWFAVFRKKEEQRGAFVTVIRKGAQQAGALFIVHNQNDGHVSLYAPAPSILLENDETDRVFEQVPDCADQESVDKYLESQIRFDPDLWIIETDGGAGLPDIKIITAEV